MRRAPYVPGALPPLEPPAVLGDPAIHFDMADLKAACRRIDAICTRASLAIIAIGAVLVLASALR